MSSTIPQRKFRHRLQAFGDVVITLPYVQALQSLMPTTQFHFLTREEFSAIPFNMTIFTMCLSRGGRNPKRQWLKACSLIHHSWGALRYCDRSAAKFFKPNDQEKLRPNPFVNSTAFLCTQPGSEQGRRWETWYRAVTGRSTQLKLRDNDRGLHKLHPAHFDPAKKLFVWIPLEILPQKIGLWILYSVCSDLVGNYRRPCPIFWS